MIERLKLSMKLACSIPGYSLLHFPDKQGDRVKEALTHEV